ncbi:MAG: endonuclease V [Candidatus Micrarchaeia archaeon]
MGYDIQSLRAIQQRLAGSVILEDRFGEIRLIGGIDIAYKGDNAACAIVLFDYEDMKMADSAYVCGKVKFPYIPGLLSFREGPIMKKAYAHLNKKPDLLLVNGNGILHPRFIGIASHLGVELGAPTIGVTQHLLCGQVGEDGKIYIDGRHVGYSYTSKKGCAPIYISPGHMVSLQASLEIVKRCILGHKLPEPLHLADKLSKKYAKLC